MEKIKVLRIISRLNIGGPAIHAILLTEGLNRDKFESILVTGKVESAEADMMYLANQKGVRPIVIPELMRQIRPFRDMLAFLKIFSLIWREKPDIVHTHTAKAGALGRLAALLYNLLRKNKKTKLVHTFHGTVFESYFGKISTVIFIWIERVFAQFSDKIVAVSGKVKEDLLSLRVGNSQSLTVIHLGLELDRFLSISASPHMNSAVRVGIIGRLVPIKNHRMFLEAAKMIKDAQKIKTRFFIIGDGELREELEYYAARLGLDKEVIFLGWQNNLEDIYRDLDIVALTSLNEGMPVSLIEALAAGRPVIATDVGGVRDLIGDNEQGILVKSRDAGALASGIIKLADNPGLRQDLGSRGRDFVRARFGKERLFKDIELLYNSLFNKEPYLCAH